MKKTLLTIIATASLCALWACTGARYIDITTANGTTAKHVSIAPGTIATTQKSWTNTAGGACNPPSTQQVEQ